MSRSHPSAHFYDAKKPALYSASGWKKKYNLTEKHVALFS